MLRRLSHDLRDPTAFSPRSRSDCTTFAFVFVLNMLKTNAVTRRSLATMATIARCLAFPTRLYHAYGDLDALWAHFRRSSAVRTPPRSDGGVTNLKDLYFTVNAKYMLMDVSNPQFLSQRQSLYNVYLHYTNFTVSLGAEQFITHFRESRPMGK